MYILHKPTEWLSNVWFGNFVCQIVSQSVKVLFYLQHELKKIQLNTAVITIIPFKVQNMKKKCVRVWFVSKHSKEKPYQVLLWFHSYSWASIFVDKVIITVSRISKFVAIAPINAKC